MTLPASALALLMALPAQSAPTPPAGASAAVTPPSAASPAATSAPTALPADQTLAPGEVARIDDALTLTVAELDRYLGTIFARLPEGVEALEELLAETLIERAAEAAGLQASAEEAAAAERALEAQARQASGGAKGLAESLGAGVTADDVRRAMRLMVLQDKLVRSEQGLDAEAPLPPEILNGWLKRALEEAQLKEAELDDVLAARFVGGHFSKADVGRRLRASLPREEVRGVLTEMIGILLVRRRAAVLDVNITPAAATREILERNERLQQLSGSADLTYARFVEETERRTLPELLVSDKFSTEVLLRQLSEREWDEPAARRYWQEHRADFEGPAQPPAGAAPTPATTAPSPAGETAAETEAEIEAAWQAARLLVLKSLRQRTYRQLFEESRIVRAF
ncbi:MAG: hypothetical protein ACT4PU_11480 [Planctomycetota bacterium]